MQLKNRKAQVISKAEILFTMILLKEIEIETFFTNKNVHCQDFTDKGMYLLVQFPCVYMFRDKLFLPLCSKVRSIGCVFVASLSIDSLQKTLTD